MSTVKQRIPETRVGWDEGIHPSGAAEDKRDRTRDFDPSLWDPLYPAATRFLVLLCDPVAQKLRETFSIARQVSGRTGRDDEEWLVEALILFLTDRIAGEVGFADERRCRLVQLVACHRYHGLRHRALGPAAFWSFQESVKENLKRRERVDSCERAVQVVVDDCLKPYGLRSELRGEIALEVARAISPVIRNGSRFLQTQRAGFPEIRHAPIEDVPIV